MPEPSDVSVAATEAIIKERNALRARVEVLERGIITALSAPDAETKNETLRAALDWRPDGSD